MLTYNSLGRVTTRSTESNRTAAIYIVGTTNVQNTLMASYLEKTMGLNCTVAESVLEIPRPTEETAGEKRLILLDCMGGDPLTSPSELVTENSLLCLFNLDPNGGFEEESVANGVHGFFYIGDSIEKLVSGVKAVLRGEIWLSRKIMTRYILKSQKGRLLCRCDSEPRLTRREKEILLMIAQGATNAVIAEKLFISRHTVKTHIYHLFKKIKASNRSQAASWAHQKQVAGS